MSGVEAPEALARTPHPPLCPITQEPARRFVQWVSPGLLTGLWKRSAGVEVGRLLKPAGRIGLWESPTGLLFFDPRVPGDAEFYRSFYEAIDAHEMLTGPKTIRQEFRLAAAHTRPGERVLDIGCGLGGFRAYLPQAEYTGLDPNFGTPEGPILTDSLEEHAARRPGYYDAVCAFQVMEHVPDPLGFARTAAACLKPGGRLMLGVPFWPSPSTTIPNFIINAPPHHLTWWTANALRALSDRLGLTEASVEPVPLSRHEAIMYWMAKASPVKCRSDRFFAAKTSWYVALAVAYGLGRVLEALLPLPTHRGANALLLTARKPA